MKLPFTKMQGAGNDFIVIDATKKDFSLSRKQIRALANRHFGIGFDQLLVVERPTKKGVDFRYRIFNADGGEVEQCGNGARCFVKYVRARGLTSKREIRVETRGGIIGPRLEADGEVSVDMGAPRLAKPLVERLNLGSETVDLALVSMGNPHAVQRVAEVELAPVTTQGPRIERHTRFPEGVNAGYLQILTRNHIALRVWERGAGETLSCGTGACAAVAVAVVQGLADSPVRVDTRGGTLTISWAGGDNAVWMKGPAETAFEGTLDL
ncbi:MAG: diaminopimelate epimerase [Betaproteobacteria bacterium]|jgi:diaminopimelate epimerase|nr:diaminopimelate epimerase [Betaproteobacteria bacterium]